MFYDGVKDGPERAGYERLGSFEYSGGENVVSPLDLSGDAGY